jgi:ribosomal protein L40E
MSVKQAILDFVDGEIRNKIFVTPGIPAKKLNAARSQFISRDEEVIVLYDDTVFGSGKDGIAITENYIYAKQIWEVPKSIKISSIRSIESQSKSLNNLEIFLNGNLFITVSTPEKSDHAFLVGILKAAKDAAAKPEKKKGKAAPTAEAPSPVPSRSAPKAKLRSAAPEDMLSCEECRAALPTGAKFCLECGSKVTPKGICLECSTKLPEQARFCPQCGTPAGWAAPKPAQPTSDSDAPDAISGAVKSADGSRRASGSGASQADVRGCILSALEAALTEFAEEPPTQAYSQGDCHFVWQILLKDENERELTGATGDDFAVHCDVGLLEDVVVNETESMSSVLNDVRERFNQFLADTDEELLFAPSNSISYRHSGFFVYVCEVVEGGADVFRYYGKHFMFDRVVSSNMQSQESPSRNPALHQLAEKTEISLTASGRLARYFSDCHNLYTSIILDHGLGNLLKVSITVETDGQAEELEDAEEAIGDYIFDTFLTAGLIEIFGDDAYEALEFEVHVKVAPLGDTTRSAQNVASMPDSHAPNIIADYNNNVNVQKFLVKYKEFGRPAGQLDEELILLGFGTKGFSITQEDYDGVSQEDECFGDLICDTILPLKMEVGQIRVLGTCEVRCVFVHQISQKNEDDILEVVNFYIVQFQCDTILLAIYGWYDQQEFSSEYYKIISTEGVHRTSATGYLSEMTEDLQAIGE